MAVVKHHHPNSSLTPHATRVAEKMLRVNSPPAIRGHPIILSRRQRRNAAKRAVKALKEEHTNDQSQSQPQSQSSSTSHSQSHTAPTSPTPHSEDVTMEDVSDEDIVTKEQEEKVNQQEEKQQSTPAPESTSTPTTSTPMETSSEPVPAPTPAFEFSASEQKMIDTINSVSSKIDTLAQQLPTLRGQIQNHFIRLSLYHWSPKRKWTNITPEKLNRSQKTLKYSAGMVDENVLQQIFRLDSIQTEHPEIRRLRKATVTKGNDTIKQSIVLRDRMDRFLRWLPEWKPEEEKKQVEVEKKKQVVEESKPVPMEDVPAPASAPVSTQQQRHEEAHKSDEEEKEELPQPQKKQTPKKQPPQQPRASSPKKQQATPTPAPAAAPSTPALTPLQQKYAQFHLPTYPGPTFHASVQPYNGTLLIEADMDGILSEDVSVTPDVKARSITIRGVRLPRRVAPHPFGGFFGGGYEPRIQPHGFFTKTIDLDEVDPHGILDIANLTAVINARHQLQISLPRSKPQVQAQPQRTRAPVHHRTGVSYSSDEEDDGADQYSHPYAQQYYRPPQPQPRRMAHPFFGGGGFW